MTMLFMESFRRWGASGSPSQTVMQRAYATAPSSGFSLVAGRTTNGIAGRCSTVVGQFQLPTALNPTSADTYVWGFGLRIATASTRHIASCNSGASLNATNQHWSIRYNSTGDKLELYRQTTLVYSGDITRDVWHYVELKFRCNDTLGALTLRVGGTQVYSGTSLDTINTTSTFNLWYGNTASANTDFADMYLLNGSGSVNNDFLGPRVVEYLAPSGAGNSAQFTPSTGSNHTCVDEVPPNDDTDHIQSGTAGHTDLYAMGNLADITGGVAAVDYQFVGRKTDTDNRTVRRKYRQSSTNYNGSNVTLNSTSYVQSNEIIETDPATSAAWAASAVNSAEFGIEVVS